MARSPSTTRRSRWARSSPSCWPRRACSRPHSRYSLLAGASPSRHGRPRAEDQVAVKGASRAPLDLKRPIPSRGPLRLRPSTAMRVVLWGIIALVGLGLLLESIGVHGSKDERAAIRRAVRAPLADLQRRDARSLCDDFTPAVDADFADGHGSDCESNVDYAFQMTKNEAAYAPPPELPSRLQVTEISWHGSHGAAVSVYPGK